MSEVEIRKLTKEDAEIYQKIRLEMLKQNPESFGDSYEDNLKYDLNFYEERILDSYILGGFVGNSLIGTAGYFVHKGEKTQHKATVWGVYISSEYRGKRISQRLIQGVVEKCAQLFEQVLINVSAENKAALNIYNSLGFEEYGREPRSRKINNKYYDEIHMVKFLK